MILDIVHVRKLLVTPTWPSYNRQMKELSQRDYKKIIQRRDQRYDGRFYFGVVTTRIYCRPVCPAKPNPKNIVIFKSAAEAESAGYRPCKRCHPDLAPGSSLHSGTSISVKRALSLIESSINRGEDETFNVEALAESLGMTSRHLRRLFHEHLGASPIEIITTHKLHLAKKLVQETSLSISEIALSAGFKSIRRFNEAFKNYYRSSPSEWRGKRKSVKSGKQLELGLMVRSPFDWKSILAFLGRHETYGVEKVYDDRYVRFIPQKNNYAKIEISYDQKNSSLNLSLSGVELTEIRSLINRIKQLFDVNHNPNDLPKSKRIPPKGIRIPGAFDTYETAVSIILGQLVSTEQAKAKMKSLMLKYGHPVASSPEEVYFFPTPGKLKTAALEELGMTRYKANAIRELSRLIDEEGLQLDQSADINETKKRLLNIKGIGPWTAEMIAMRCLGDSDAYPKKDLIIMRALEAGLVDEEEWSSLKAYLTHILWREYGKSLSKAYTKKSQK